MDDLEKILDVPFTFSIHCRSGYLGDKCNCWRCRQKRNEEVTDETNALAKKEAKEIDKEIDRKNRERCVKAEYKEVEKILSKDEKMV